MKHVLFGLSLIGFMAGMFSVALYGRKLFFAHTVAAGTINVTVPDFMVIVGMTAICGLLSYRFMPPLVWKWPWRR